MALFESEGIAYGGIKSESLPQLPQDELLKDQQFSPLSKQNSIFSLTLDEIQLKSGKSFGSMNMDEFLANVWNVEENQVPPQSTHTEATNDNTIANPPSPLARQGSFSIPTPLCKKTVDEVWFEIQKDQPQSQKPNDVTEQEPPLRQQSFGEMTLEDFLIKAGVVQEPAAAASCQSQRRSVTRAFQNGNPCVDAHFGIGHVMELGFSSHQNNMGNHNMQGNGFAVLQIFPQSKSFAGESSNGNSTENPKEHSLVESSGKRDKKRIIDGPPEVVVERRQRRMIKNRESAARSRARKQAYTVELELELNQLKQENDKLKLIVEGIEQKRKLEVLKRKQSTMAEKRAEKLRTTRRTVSLTW